MEKTIIFMRVSPIPINLYAVSIISIVCENENLESKILSIREV